MSYLEKAKQYQDLQFQGKVWEAFEMYHDDVTIIEKATGEVRNGKAAQKAAIETWFGSVQENHGGGCECVTADEVNGITCCEVWYDVTMQGGHRMKMEEVSVQKWEGDKIVQEKFYYHRPGQ